MTLLAPRATPSILAERTKIQPWGLRGGWPDALGEYLLRRRDGSITKLPSKCTVSLEKGDTLIIRTPGGGGYGGPLERRPDLVLRDVLNGLISPEVAESDYGVVIDIQRMQVDVDATERLRRSKRAV